MFRPLYKCKSKKTACSDFISMHINPNWEKYSIAATVNVAAMHYNPQMIERPLTPN